MPCSDSPTCCWRSMSLRTGISKRMQHSECSVPTRTTSSSCKVSFTCNHSNDGDRNPFTPTSNSQLCVEDARQLHAELRAFKARGSQPTDLPWNLSWLHVTFAFLVFVQLARSSARLLWTALVTGCCRLLFYPVTMSTLLQIVFLDQVLRKFSSVLI